MNATEWAVVLGGVAAIGLVNWYFLFAGSGGGSRGEPTQGDER